MKAIEAYRKYGFKLIGSVVIHKEQRQVIKDVRRGGSCVFIGSELEIHQDDDIVIMDEDMIRLEQVRQAGNL